MDLADAAIFFDDDPVYDGYTAAYLFSGQTASFDDSTSDGATLRRRVLSTAPSIVPPTRRVVKMYDDYWLLGVVTTDGFYGEKIRQHIPMKRATDLATLRTPGQMLAAAAGTQAYVHKHYFKEVSNALTTSDMDTFWNVFVAPGEPVVKGSIISVGTTHYRVRNDYLPVEGLRVAQSDQLEAGAATTAVFETGAIDPVTEERAGGTVTLAALRIEASKFYRFRAGSDPHLVKGDEVVFLPSNAAVKQNAVFVMASVKWRIASVQAELDCLAALVRRV